VDTTKYARLEDEERWLIDALPGDATAPRLIEDRYVDGTRLRLRTVTDATGTLRKLGHKVRPDSARPSAVWHTTLYLDEPEFARLATLPSRTLRKRRWSLDDGAVADEFLDGLDGLVLVEAQRPHPARPGGVEVTDDERFCGGSLAALDDVGAPAFLALARALLP
jgi:hypothetical protein